MVWDDLGNGKRSKRNASNFSEQNELFECGAHPNLLVWVYEVDTQTRHDTALLVAAREMDEYPKSKTFEKLSTCRSFKCGKLDEIVAFLSKLLIKLNLVAIWYLQLYIWPC
jgi:hypothetical protein